MPARWDRRCRVGPPVRGWSTTNGTCQAARGWGGQCQLTRPAEGPWMGLPCMSRSLPPRQRDPIDFVSFTTYQHHPAAAPSYSVSISTDAEYIALILRRGACCMTLIHEKVCHSDILLPAQSHASFHRLRLMKSTLDQRLHDYAILHVMAYTDSTPTVPCPLVCDH